MAKIILADNPLNDLAVARDLAPPDLDMVIARHGSPEFKAALADAVCLVGFGDGTMDDAFYKAAPNLKLVQLLSAGYDRCDLESARRARVPICNNGGANSTAVSEHAILLMMAVCRRTVWQHQRREAPPFHFRGDALAVTGLLADEPDATALEAGGRVADQRRKKPVGRLGGVIEHDLAPALGQWSQAHCEVRMRHGPAKPSVRNMVRSGHAGAIGKSRQRRKRVLGSFSTAPKSLRSAL